MKLQLQSQRDVRDRQFKGPVDCARQIIRTEGIRGMWSGFTGSLAFRSNFFWMFSSFEVGWFISSGNVVIDLNSLQALMRILSQIKIREVEVGFSG